MQFYVRRLSLLFFLLMILVVFFSFEFHRYMTLEYVHRYYLEWCNWRDEHYYLAIVLYVISYTVVVASFIPAASVLTVLGGVFFGVWLATLLSIFSATLGAFIAFAAVRLAFHDWALRKTVSWLDWIKEKVRGDAFFFLLFLRLVPIIPFWMVNIAAGLLNISSLVFVFSTVIGIIPGTTLFAAIGSGMARVMSLKTAPSWSQFINLRIGLPLFLLALLSLLPIWYKHRKKRGEPS